MHTYEAIWLVTVFFTLVGCLYWRWRVKEHLRAAKANERYQEALELYERNKARDEAYMAESYRLNDIHERCLANSTRTRYSRSTLRKTKV